MYTVEPALCQYIMIVTRSAILLIMLMLLS